VLSVYGCTYLKDVDDGADDKGYDVVKLDSIKACEYVVQDFKRAGFYHVSAFKWDRATVGFVDDPVDEHGAPL